MMIDMPGNGKTDKRARLRAPLLVLKVRVEDNGRVFFGYAKNISKGGLFIASSNPREPGSRFLVEVPLPYANGKTARCTCEVVWKREFSRDSPYEPGMGLKFIDLPETFAAELDRWIQAQLPPEEF
jgi:uncharacterized protein (TIGR02266 family)